VRDLDLYTLLEVYGGSHGSWVPAMTALTVLGSGWATLAFVPMLWHTRTRRFAAALSIAVAAQSVLVWAIKLLVGRVRPWIALGLPPPIGTPHDGSFPSGHAAGAFCVAAFLVIALPVAWRGSPRSALIVRGLAVLLAALIALSRVYLGAHFPSDVLGGALLGALVGGASANIHVSRRLGVEEAAKKR
jgi:membrane-associated phospholipid phosphatase